MGDLDDLANATSSPYSPAVVFSRPGVTVRVDAVIVGSWGVPVATIESVTDQVHRRVSRNTAVCWFLLAAAVTAFAGAYHFYALRDALHAAAVREVDADTRAPQDGRGDARPHVIAAKALQQRSEESAPYVWYCAGGGVGLLLLWFVAARRTHEFVVYLNRPFGESYPVRFGKRRETAHQFIAAIAAAKGGHVPIYRPPPPDDSWIWVLLLLSR